MGRVLVSLCGRNCPLHTKAWAYLRLRLHATKSQLFAKTAANQQRPILSHDIRARWSKGAVGSSFVL